MGRRGWGWGWGGAAERNKNKNSVISNKLKVSAPTGYLYHYFEVSIIKAYIHSFTRNANVFYQRNGKIKSSMTLQGLNTGSLLIARYEVLNDVCV